MKILLTGLTGYIWKRLLPVLPDQGNEVFSLVSDMTRIQDSFSAFENHTGLESGLLNQESLNKIPEDISS